MPRKCGGARARLLRGTATSQPDTRRGDSASRTKQDDRPERDRPCSSPNSRSSAGARRRRFAERLRIPQTEALVASVQVLADEQKQGSPDAAEFGQEGKSAAPDSELPRVPRIRDWGSGSKSPA